MGTLLGLMLVAAAMLACALVVSVADRLFGLSNIIRRIRDALRSARRYLWRE